MKYLILVRHAKSDWPENTDDFDRPLSENGIEDAVKISSFLKYKDIEIDQFISSPAIRAFNTCKIFNKIYDIELKTEIKLYHPSEDHFTSVIYELDDTLKSVAIFSHNNGISNFANSLTENIFHFPTCGVAGFEIDCDTWLDFEGAKKKLIFFYEPKKFN